MRKRPVGKRESASDNACPRFYQWAFKKGVENFPGNDSNTLESPSRFSLREEGFATWELFRD